MQDLDLNHQRIGVIENLDQMTKLEVSDGKAKLTVIVINILEISISML